MNLTKTIGWLLGHDNVSEIDSARLSFAASWAHAFPVLVVLGGLALVATTIWFYLDRPRRVSSSTNVALTVLRSVSLCLIFLVLADPIVELSFVSLNKPVMWFLLDGSDSMSIPDQLPAADQTRLEMAVDMPGYLAASSSQPERSVGEPSQTDDLIARVDYARALLARKKENLIEQLSKRFRLQFFTFAESNGVRELITHDQPEGRAIARDWSTTGRMTALGDAFEDLARKRTTESLSAVLVLSDFNQNSGTAALAAAKKLGVPVFTVGVGPQSAIDLSVELIATSKIKKAESSTINVVIHKNDADETPVQTRLSIRPFGSTSADSQLIGETTSTLTGNSSTVEFSYTPDSAGRFILVAEVDPIEGEVITQNNQAEREVTVIDDFLRLMYVESEPTWEWRFIKEVFHRDKLIGRRGFRTFIRSADPIVRETNELFLSTLTPPRSEFFENDVIFLGDMPRTALSDRFCEMTKEFVSEFGGGLVVIAGPRFGPGQLAGTPLADLLPVVIDADVKRRDGNGFTLSLTSAALQYDFMRIGNSPEKPLNGWDSLGQLPWYQPALRVEARGTRVLAQHPTDKCADGQTAQPLIAIRQYGRGEVVYIGFNEMWRLRRLHGETFYRQFWGQLIHRLGLSHALGRHKRFVVRTDQTTYHPDDQVLVTVEAYDREFQPLDEKQLRERRLTATLMRPSTTANAGRLQTMSIPQLKPGVFETRLPVATVGEYRLQVNDPSSNEVTELEFQVTDVSLERRSAVRNESLQSSIATETNGKSYDLLNVNHFIHDFTPDPRKETSLEIIPLWNNWLMFGTVIGCLSVEWFLRKQVNLN
ncbi:hypothetical protein [Schlesneria paludicola]|uniref:hypothetical protein n=1 Tax=Schlesneria paludicola TaxID=360056 RepID=UPI00029A418F|nr:hypothetical protein [Schlesneria paludicola]